LLNRPGSPDWVKDSYKTTAAKLSTYLVCFAVSDFIVEKAPKDLYRTNVSIWGPSPLMVRKIVLEIGL